VRGRVRAFRAVTRHGATKRRQADAVQSVTLASRTRNLVQEAEEIHPALKKTLFRASSRTPVQVCDSDGAVKN